MKAVITIYLLIIHIFIGIVILKTDVISRIKVKLGYEVISVELTPYYYTMLAFQRRVDKNIPDKSFIFIGDSLTQGLAVTAVSQKSVNYGIGQDTTVGVLNRIPFYQSILRSKIVIIEIGINDLKRRTNAEIVENYLKIIDLIPNNIPILFNSIFPVDEIISKRAGINSRIQKLNHTLNTICKANKRLYCLEVPHIFFDISGNLSNDYHIGDGIHLNGLGNKIWISKLKSITQKIVENNKREIQ